ncbi:hypothetical protein CEXT_209721 [Caerostris extrusa]|uniref:Uncharacterized protein n=1 Tax=Caerostris extrusa TaxID=172846 RepID=A0AAV4VSF6_CAEEX|nr:hypothetical protein CEXT_209721 [Caerostris extrusa]
MTTAANSSAIAIMWKQFLTDYSTGRHFYGKVKQHSAIVQLFNYEACFSIAIVKDLNLWLRDTGASFTDLELQLAVLRQ